MKTQNAVARIQNSTVAKGQIHSGKKQLARQSQREKQGVERPEDRYIEREGTKLQARSYTEVRIRHRI